MISVVVAVALDLTAPSAAVVLSFGGAGFAASFGESGFGIDGAGGCT